jgi:membrane protein implicated in regulation of membrane protease activity
VRAVGSDDSVVGRVGLVTHATRGPDGAGEVKVSIRGGSEIFLAWSDEPLPKGATVLVVASRGARALDVVPWTAP